MDNYTKESLSQLVRRLMKEKRLSLKDVEVNSGGNIDKSYVSRIMNGNVKNITLEKLVALARGLGEDPHALFAAYHGHPPRGPIDPKDVPSITVPVFLALMQKVSADPDLVRLMQEAARLPHQECKAVVTYIRYLKSKAPKRSHSSKAV